VTRERRLRASAAWFRLLLRCYPPDFRDLAGDDVVEACLDRARGAADRGAGSLGRVWMAALSDAIRNGLGERIAPAASWRRGGNWGRDVELVRRRLVRAPLFVTATIATLTIGLGIFAVVATTVDKVLLEPLPFRNSQDLYIVQERVGGDEGSTVLSGAVIAALRQAGGVIDGAAGMVSNGVSLPGSPQREGTTFRAMQVSPDLFDLLGVRPALGRVLRAGESGPSSPNVIVLTDSLWRRFGADRAMVGTAITIGTTPFTVVGVLPPGFRFSATATEDIEAYIPLYVDLAAEKPYIHDYRVLLRAHPGTSQETLRAAIHNLARPFAALDNHNGRGMTLEPVGLQAAIVDDERPALIALGFTVVFVLLVLTLNLASLLLTRATGREREFAVSRALGASGAAIARATLLEGAILGLGGGIGGALLGSWLTRILTGLAPEDFARRDTIAMDARLAVLVMVVGAALGLIAAAAPALWASRMSLGSLLTTSNVRGGVSSGRLRRGLVTVQVALCLVLVSVAGLVAHSFQQLLAVRPGFDASGVLTLSLSQGSWLFPTDADAYAFQDRLESALRGLPGVTAIGMTTTLPMRGGTNVAVVSVPGAPGNTGDRNRDEPTVDRMFARPGYVEAIGMRLIEGRDFDRVHRGDGEVIIDQHLARQFFPAASPIGATLVNEKGVLTIVGVVEQPRMYWLHKDGRPQLFVRTGVRVDDVPQRRPSSLVVRTSGDPRALVRVVQKTIHDLDRRVPISAVKTMADIVAERRSRERISAVMIGALAVGGLLLVAMGLVGVIAGSVTPRRGELAVRLALGATHRRLLRLVVGEGAMLIFLGLIIGAPGVYAAGGVLRGLLIGISPLDPPTLLTAAAVFAAIAVAACYVPATRVLSIDPAPLLRQE
jgi:predicted permease